MAKAGVHGRAVPRGRGRAEEYSLGREVTLIALGCLWLALGTAVLGMCAGLWYGGRVAVTVLEEIGERDFGGPRDRFRRYGEFFQALDPELYAAEQGRANIIGGVYSYTWVVSPAGSTERRVFQWDHVLETNQVKPRSNPALCLDVELGYMTDDQAREYRELQPGDERYDPNDTITLAIVQSEISLIQPEDLSSGWERVLPEGPVAAPLITPEEGKDRQHQAAEERRRAEEEEAGEEETEPGEATEVVEAEEDATEA